MNLKDKKFILSRPYKVVYQDGNKVVKVFTKEHPKANVFNEALCQARVEETGLHIPKVLEVTNIDGEWALVLEYFEGKTLSKLMKEAPGETDVLLEKFVDLQLTMHTKSAPRLTLQKDKLKRKINSLKDTLDASTRYELQTRLDSMPTHTKLCHGDFNPSNVIVQPDGKMAIVDWSHATQGNASADAAITYLQFALKDQDLADRYLRLFCKKSDTAIQYVQKWLPIVAAAELTKKDPANTEFLMRWIDVFDYQ